MSSKRKPTDSDPPATNSIPNYQGPDAPGEPQGRTAVKRQRVSRACDQCRAAREKCDGIQPLCFPCVSQNRTCTYQANPKKRGVQTGYIRTLELALACVFEKVPGSEDALGSLLTDEGGQGQRLLTGPDSPAANRLHERWRASPVHRVIDRALSGEAPLAGADAPTDTDGETDKLLNPSLASDTSRGALHLHETSAGTVAPPSHQGQRLISAENGNRTISFLASCSPRPLTGLKLPLHHWRLMDIYFSYTHCWLPILEKQEMFQACYLYSSEHGLDLSPKDPATAAHAELWSALALASFQDASSSGSCTETGDAGSGRSMTPDQIYDVARSLIPAEDGPLQIHHTRALILLSLVNLGKRKLASSWILVGKAVRIFLGVSSSDGCHPVRDGHRHRAAFMACFVMDTMVSQQYDKPPHLTAADMPEATNISENGIDEWQPWAACEGFGRGSSHSRDSRSPAHCLSTFNQLYDIFNVVSRSIGARRTKAEDGSAAAIGQAQLQQAINLAAPFGRYILSQDTDSAPVPPPYLLKVLHIWAAAVVGTISADTARLMAGVVEQYQMWFGTCATPPFFTACLSYLMKHPQFGNFNQQDQLRVTTLEADCSSIWDDSLLPPSSNSRDTAPGHPSVTGSHPIAPDSQSDSVLPHLGHPFLVTKPGPLQGSSPSGPRAHDLDRSYMFPLYGLQQGSLRPPDDALAHDTIIDMEHSITAQPATAHHLDIQYQTASHQMLGAPLSDYDALLDDLATIDCADRVEADLQFMANLGFAPGCTLSDILSLDVGTL